MRRRDAIALALTMAVAAGVVFSRTVWAPCFNDPGEFQLAAAVGGISHPPGHAGISLVMSVLCRLIPLAPHLTVSAANAVFVLAAVAILMLLQLRTGANPLAAAIASLLFLTDDQVWHAATVPEPYGTCLLLFAGSVWAFLSWLNERRAWRFWLAVFLFAYLAANRAPTLPLSVAFVLILFYDRRAREAWERQRVRKLLIAVAVALVPFLLTLGTLWVRDVPGNPYNYLDQTHPSEPFYPADSTGFADKTARLWWLLSAAQFDYMFHPTVTTVRAQARWLLSELGAGHGLLMLITFAVLIIGGRILWNRNRTCLVFCLLVLLGGVVPVLLIRVVSHTAFIPPILFVLAWLLGLGLSSVMRWHRSAAWNTLVVAAVCFVVWWTADAAFLRKEVEYDATEFIEAIDLDDLPAGALLICKSPELIPLIYAQHVYGIRPDVKVLEPAGRLSAAYLQAAPDNVYTSQELPPGLKAELVGTGPIRRIHLLDKHQRQPPAADDRP